jgi:hypothetical protein
LAVKLKWEYSAGDAPHNIILTVATKHDPKNPVVHATLAGERTQARFWRRLVEP